MGQAKESAGRLKRSLFKGKRGQVADIPAFLGNYMPEIIIGLLVVVIGLIWLMKQPGIFQDLICKGFLRNICG